MAVTVSVQADTRAPGKAGMVIGLINFGDGEQQQAAFEALAGEDALIRLNAMVAPRQADRITVEIIRNVSQVTALGSLASPRLVLSTAADNFAALRIAYQDATKIDAIMIGDFLNTLTDAQLRTAFNMTQAQVTSLRTNKLTPAANAASTIRASSGA